MSPWLSVVLFGVVIFGYAWMLPKPKPDDPIGKGELPSEAAYDKLLEDLEAENRELVDAVASFKREQDETVDRLSRRVRDLEQLMRDWKEQPSSPSASAQLQASSADSPLMPAVSSGPSAFVTPEDVAFSAASGSGTNSPHQEEAVSELPEIAPTSIRARYAELLAMHERGRSVEQIAKSLGLNKGEVQLILQLARREEGPNA